MDVLGVSGFYHDSAAARVRDGTVVAAAQGERILRTYVAAGPRGLQTRHRALAEWLRRKLWIPLAIERHLVREGQPAWSGDAARIELD